MLQNYLKITFRNLLKNKGYFFINLLGLTLGVTCALLIFVVIRYQKSFDSFHTKLDRLYRVYSYGQADGNEDFNGGSTYALLPALQTDFSDLEAVTQVRSDGDEVVMAVRQEGKTEDVKYMERAFAFVEPAYFEMFSFPLLIGEAKTALKEPKSLILTEKMAKKYFGNSENAIGKIIRWNNTLDLKVTGVAENIPINTDYRFEFFISYSSLNEIVSKEELGEWGSIWSGIETFVLLPEKYTQAQVEARFSAFGEKYLNEEQRKERTYKIQPLKDTHFDTRMSNFGNNAVPVQLLWALGLVAAFLVITACINFINLATAQAVNRSKEVGIRKVLGSSRLALMKQFLGETFFISFFAILLSLGLAEFLLPYVNQLLSLEMEKRFLWNTDTALFLISLTVTVAVLSGLYPAFVLSGFNPILAIKNSITAHHTGGMNLRRGLIIMQFAISQILITSTIIAIQQMDYFNTKEMGFAKDGVVVLELPKNDSLRFATLKTELQRIAGIDKVSFSIGPPASGNNSITNIGLTERDQKEDINANMKRGDVDYVEVYGLKIVAGRNINPSNDTLYEVLVNETMVRKLGFKTNEEILGKTLRRGSVPRPIVGVIKDFHLYSLSAEISPVYFGAGIGRYQTVGVKFSTKNTQEMMSKIEKLWTRVFPEYVYSYKFLDQSLAEFYESVKQLSNLFKIFAFIAIFIGCIGLYGLVSFMVTRKTKEIGIRKVLGASVGQILSLFSKEFAKLLLIAFVIASPLVYYAMDAWLSEFAYHISISWQIFLITVFSTAIIAMLTVGYKSLKAAVANPVKALRAE